MRSTLSMRTTALATGCTLGLFACGSGETEQEETSAPTAAVIIASPATGQTVEGNLTIRLETTGVEVRPAGTNEPGTGHHHLFIDRDITPVGVTIPSEAGVVHLGMAQTEYVFENLAPGEHTVIAVFGDHIHVRLPDVATDTVRVTVAGT